MKILVFNWRDIKNPSSGGAEILTHEMEKRWVKEGHSVTHFSSFFSSAKKEELIDGVKILRRGHADARFLFWSVHFFAFIYYFKYFRNNFDIVIDEIHGLPFFTPLYIKEKKVALICELANELWFILYGSLFGSIGRIIEVLYIKIFYKNTIFATISDSTKKELIKNGVEKNKIHILPMGINTQSVKKTAKETIPSVVYIGRLSKAKGIEDAILSVNILKSKGEKIRLTVVGRGDKDYSLYLKSFCKELNIQDNVEFLGYISEKEKFETIASSHILVSPSAKEGFGLTIPEAGSMGVPSVVYNSLGLSDIVIDHKTGLICQQNTPENLADNINILLKDKILYKTLSEGARKESLRYNWDRTAEKMLTILRAS
ncbi:MAG: glycosyltransferase family 4 protein [Candidatus Levybacteria bacterium]|nr:glycosyltransferase family 4 protein [Candidatus Levybacteria bacterium]